jgi:hypothetical protein
MKYIYAGMKAYTTDGHVMPVRGVLLDADTYERRYLVLAANGLFGPDVQVPFSVVWLIDDAVHLNLTLVEISALPAFHRFGHADSATAALEPAWHYIQRRRAHPHSHARPMRQ